ncbi:PfkB family carbohydrate kinase [Amycolatopsis acidiphila]|nr:PfkB family carbohydrate kinase [Amycolatopsis acidiphila]UIJ57047.1 PfkB family carbohydrate kinase [Amycolatopsis acidiphila]GHG53665.1 hypothetical protein GCM10017788_02560 [Amycolatopsis acidiphila]
MALIVVDEAGENQIAVGAGANDEVAADDVRRAIEAAAPGLGCVLVSTEISEAAVRAAVEAAARAGVTCVLNPAPVTGVVAGLLSYGPLLTPNRGELSTLAEAPGSVRATTAHWPKP